MIDNPSKRVIDLTAEEFANVLLHVIKRLTGEEKESVPAKRLVYGIAGIAQLFNCSITTAHRIKASGKIDEAISQSGHMIVVDAELALQLLKKR